MLPETNFSDVEVVSLAHSNLRDDAYEFLKKRILTHYYPPGYRFELDVLSKQLGISRTPLKEALHRLEAEGLVHIRPRRGTYVTTIDPDEVAESFDVRYALEMYAAEQAVTNATRQEIAHIEALAAEMSALLRAENYQAIVEKYIELDHTFHKAIVQLAHNRRLSEIYEQVGVHMQIAHIRNRFTAADSKKNTEPEHAVILDTLRRGDKRAFLKSIGDHIQNSKERALQALKQG